jgi:hypothetical protein
MSEHQKTAAFLRELILHSDSAELHQLQERLATAEREQRCLSMAIRLMLVIAMLSLSGLGFSAVLVDDFFRGSNHVVVQLFGALVLSSFFCLLSFALYSYWRRRALLQLHADCRRLILAQVNARISGGPLRDRWPGLAEALAQQTLAQGTPEPADSNAGTSGHDSAGKAALESFAGAAVEAASQLPAK